MSIGDDDPALCPPDADPLPTPWLPREDHAAALCCPTAPHIPACPDAAGHVSAPCPPATVHAPGCSSPAEDHPLVTCPPADGHAPNPCPAAERPTLSWCITPMESQ